MSTDEMSFEEISALLDKPIQVSTNEELVARLEFKQKQQAYYTKEFLEYFLYENQINEIQDELEARAN